MTCGSRCQSAISIAVTAAALSVLVLWVTSHFSSYAIGAYHERRLTNGFEYTFIGLHSDTGQVGVGRNWRQYTWIPPTADSTEFMGDWEWKLEASLPGRKPSIRVDGQRAGGFLGRSGIQRVEHSRFQAQ